MRTDFQSIADAALAQCGSASAAIFLTDTGGDLVLAAASGITGEPLDRLIDAVRSGDHPVTRTATSGETAFDVKPIAPGGPALRSHVALVQPQSDGQVVGVLALAHQEPLTDDQRRAAEELARQASQLA